MGRSADAMEDSGKMADLKLSNSPPFLSLAALAGVAITFAFSVKRDWVDVIVYGAIWGGVVGVSLALPIDSLMNLRDYKWPLVGWVTVAVCYGAWVVLAYQGTPENTLVVAIYWRVLGWALASALVGWLGLGALLMAKLDQSQH